MELAEDTSVGELGGEAAEARAGLLRRQVKVWTGQLVDLSGRNNLLFYRDLKRGTLDLSDAVRDCAGSRDSPQIRSQEVPTLARA